MHSSSYVPLRKRDGPSNEGLLLFANAPCLRSSVWKTPEITGHKVLVHAATDRHQVCQTIHQHSSGKAWQWRPQPFFSSWYTGMTTVSARDPKQIKKWGHGSLRHCQRLKKKKKIQNWTGSNNWPACYLKVTELLLTCSGLEHTVTKVKANIHLIRIYLVLWQTGGWCCNGLWAERSSSLKSHHLSTTRR